MQRALFLPAELARIQRQGFTNFVSHCLAGRRTPRREEFPTVQAADPGDTVQASDRDYVKQPDGSVRRIEITSPRSTSRSAIYVATRPSRDKYGNLRLTA